MRNLEKELVDIIHCADAESLGRWNLTTPDYLENYLIDYMANELEKYFNVSNGREKVLDLLIAIQKDGWELVEKEMKKHS